MKNIEEITSLIFNEFNNYLMTTQIIQENNCFEDQAIITTQVIENRIKISIISDKGIAYEKLEKENQAKIIKIVIYAEISADIKEIIENSIVIKIISFGLDMKNLESIIKQDIIKLFHSSNKEKIKIKNKMNEEYNKLFSSELHYLKSIISKYINENTFKYLKENIHEFILQKNDIINFHEEIKNNNYQLKEKNLLNLKEEDMEILILSTDIKIPAILKRQE